MMMIRCCKNKKIFFNFDKKIKIFQKYLTYRYVPDDTMLHNLYG